MDFGHDITLIVRAQAGERAAVEAMLGAIAPPLRRYLTRLIGQRADDVLQETLFRIWKNLGWLREPSLFRPWCYRIATREALRMMRRERKHEHADDTALAFVAADIDDPALRLLAERLVGHVTPQARVVIAAHVLEGLTLEETAAAAELPLGTVKSRLASGLKQIRALTESSS